MARLDGTRSRPTFVRDSPKTAPAPKPSQAPKASTVPKFLEGWKGWQKNGT